MDLMVGAPTSAKSALAVAKVGVDQVCQLMFYVVELHKTRNFKADQNLCTYIV